MIDGRLLNSEPSPDDARDFPFEADQAVPLPERYLVSGMGPILNQGNTGTCGGHAGIGLRQWQEKRDGRGVINGDPYELYDLCKQVEGVADPNRVLGTTCRTVLRVLKGSGTPLYNGTRAGKILTYWRVPTTETAVKQAILKHGPVVVRSDWDRAWMRLPRNRIIPAPSGTKAGGHIFLLIGWDDDVNGGSWVMRNSWGRWSQSGNGNGYLRRSYFSPRRPEVWASTDISE